MPYENEKEIAKEKERRGGNDGRHGEQETPTPLSDPVLTAIFQNADVSGLAMESFLNATLGDSGDKPVSRVVEVTPQSVHSNTSDRGFRIDVKASTDVGEIALIEVQITPFAATVERDLLYSEQVLAGSAKRGDRLERVVAGMPRVIVVNILEHAIRKTGGYHQVIELTYREAPHERATDRLTIHNLELDKFRKEEREGRLTPLQCWLMALHRAQDGKKLLSEVVEMDKQLKAYYDSDPGFAQFVDRHGAVADLPEIRQAYRRWQYDVICDALDKQRRDEEHKAQLERSKAEGRAEGKAEGRSEGEMAIATNAFAVMKNGRSPDDIAQTLKGLGIPDETIEAARSRACKE